MVKQQFCFILAFRLKIRNMNNTFNLLIAILLLTAISSGCSKENRYQNRIEGEWLLSEFSINNVDVLDDVQFAGQHDFIIEFEFYGDGNFDTEITELTNSDDASTTVDFLTLYGTWEIVDDKLKMSHINSTEDDYTPALTYLFLDGLADNVEEYTFDEFTISELDKNTLILEANVQGYEIDIVADN